MSFVPVVSTPYEPNPKYINSFSYSVNDLQLSKQITFNVVLFDQYKLPICAQLITMAGDDYSNWGSDDTYVVHFICSKLGLTPLSDVPPPVDPTPTPVEPTPVEPTPVEPTPVEPTPVEPTPVEPTPVEPTPVEPTPVEPTPVEPTPVEPTPTSSSNEVDFIENVPVMVP
jgi:hypothetical protein